VLPDPKLTPGDALPAVMAADICTPGWATEHRHVTESMRDQVYAEYGGLEDRTAARLTTCFRLNSAAQTT
jgi:hypothetical protein